jgi:hypothetical protein
MIARGDALKDVAAQVGCSRSTLWRVLQRSERLRARVAEEQRFLAVEAAGRFRGLQAAAVDAIEAAVRQGNLRAAFWVADRLGLARIDIGEARAGLDLAEDAAAWGEAPPPDPAVYAVGAPLELEPDPEPEPEAAPSRDAGGAGGQPADAVGATEAAAPPAAAAPPVPPRRRATFSEACFTTFHTAAKTRAHKTGHAAGAWPIPDLLKTLPRTAAAWPQMPPSLTVITGRSAAEIR